MELVEYQSQELANYCQQKADRIKSLIRKGVESVAEIGKELIEVKSCLPHGFWGLWLENNFGWSQETARKYMLLANAVERNPRILEFRSIEAAIEFPTLPPTTQDAVMEKEAFSFSAFKATIWEHAMQERLEDVELDENIRFGDVLSAIEEAKEDPALCEVADRLYEQHRETFALLSDRTPEENDVEVGYKEPRPPDDDTPNAQLVEGESGYWICKWDGESFQPIQPITKHVLLWPGPTLIAAFPKTGNGPVSNAWQRSAVDAVCMRLNASTMASLYGEIV